MARGGNKTGRTPPKFVQVYYWMMQTEAWATMPPGPRALYLELKRQYNGHNNGAVFLSHRDAAKALHVHRNTVGPWFKALEERGFIEERRAEHPPTRNDHAQRRADIALRKAELSHQFGVQDVAAVPCDLRPSAGRSIEAPHELGNRLVSSLGRENRVLESPP